MLHHGVLHFYLFPEPPASAVTAVNHNIEWNIIMTITDDQALTLHIARLQVRSGATIILCVAGQCTLDIYIVITAQETVNNSDQDKLLFVKLNVCHTLESTQMTN